MSDLGRIWGTSEVGDHWALLGTTGHLGTFIHLWDTSGVALAKSGVPLGHT